MRIEDDLVIDAPVEVVWDLTVDVASWPDLLPTVTTLERLDAGPFGIGSQARIKQPGQRQAVWTVTVFEPPHRFVWETTVAGVAMAGEHHVEAEGDGCRNHLAIELRGRGAGLLGRLVRARTAKVIATENRCFQEIAEARSPT